MTTRAASAAITQRAKQSLVNILFKSDYARKGPQAHRKLDAASYSYTDLKDAYLKRIHCIHPDKCTSNAKDIDQNNINQDTLIKGGSWNDNIYDWEGIRSKTKKEYSLHDAFIELQDAWKKYDKVVKSMQQGQSESEMRGVQEDFTLFGVGCSFADNVEERDLRSQFMDQACRGWLKAGEITELSVHDENVTLAVDKQMLSSEDEKVSLIDEEMFVANDEKHAINLTSRKSLIDHLVRRYKR